LVAKHPPERDPHGILLHRYLLRCPRPVWKSFREVARAERRHTCQSLIIAMQRYVADFNRQQDRERRRLERERGVA
jgi:hypothetical protein